MSGFFFLPIVASVFLFLFAYKLHRFCEGRQKLYRSSCSEKLSLLFFNKLSLGSIFVSILFIIGETSFLWNTPPMVIPDMEAQMWDVIETFVIFFLAWLCYHSRDIVDMKFRFTEVARKNKILEGIITAAAGYMWLKDSDGRYIFCDHAFCHDFFGLSTNDCEVIGFNDCELIEAYRVHSGRHDFGDLCVETDVITRLAGVPCHFLEFGNIGSGLFVLDVIKTPLFDESGLYEGCVGFAWPNKGCEFESVMRCLNGALANGKAKKIADNVYQIFDVSECPLVSHLVKE